jgi:hypothetical protein
MNRPSPSELSGKAPDVKIQEHFLFDKTVNEFLIALERLVESHENETFLFLEVGLDGTVGDLNSYLSYTLLPQIACIFPFLDCMTRACFSIYNQHLVPSYQRTSFSSFPGNVLTGPLHGLAINGNKIKKLLHFTKAKTPNLQNFQCLGAWFGLVALELKMRNMASSQLICPQKLSPLPLEPLSIRVDPFI